MEAFADVLRVPPRFHGMLLVTHSPLSAVVVPWSLHSQPVFHITMHRAPCWYHPSLHIHPQLCSPGTGTVLAGGAGQGLQSWAVRAVFASDVHPALHVDRGYWLDPGMPRHPASCLGRLSILPVATQDPHLHPDPSIQVITDLCLVLSHSHRQLVSSLGDRPLLTNRNAVVLYGGAHGRHCGAAPVGVKRL
jgi:hypothetical protein